MPLPPRVWRQSTRLTSCLRCETRLRLSCDTRLHVGHNIGKQAAVFTSSSIPLHYSPISSNRHPKTTSLSTQSRRPLAAIKMKTSKQVGSSVQQSPHMGHSHSHGHHHNHDNTFLTSTNSKDPGVRITRIGLATNLGMAIAKGTGGVLFHSQA